MCAICLDCTMLYISSISMSVAHFNTVLVLLLSVVFVVFFFLFFYCFFFFFFFFSSRRRHTRSYGDWSSDVCSSDLANGFKLLPGYERRYTPRSDYMLAALQPHLEDLLFLGSRYEEYFDTFEVFWALVYADLKRDGTWGPPGRFCWKHSSRPEESPLLRLIEEAKAGGPAWPPLQQGLFTGSLERFLEISQTY